MYLVFAVKKKLTKTKLKLKLYLIYVQQYLKLNKKLKIRLFFTHRGEKRFLSAARTFRLILKPLFNTSSAK